MILYVIYYMFFDENNYKFVVFYKFFIKWKFEYCFN